MPSVLACDAQLATPKTGLTNHPSHRMQGFVRIPSNPLSWVDSNSCQTNGPRQLLSIVWEFGDVVPGASTSLSLRYSTSFPGICHSNSFPNATALPHTKRAWASNLLPMDRPCRPAHGHRQMFKLQRGRELALVRHGVRRAAGFTSLT